MHRGELIDDRSPVRPLVQEGVLDYDSGTDRPRLLFVTGRLAGFALRQVLDELAPRAGFIPEVAVLPISVAALLSPRWLARHLEGPEGIERVTVPGLCQGDLAPVIDKARVPVERGPDD